MSGPQVVHVHHHHHHRSRVPRPTRVVGWAWRRLYGLIQAIPGFSWFRTIIVIVVTLWSYATFWPGDAPYFPGAACGPTEQDATGIVGVSHAAGSAVRGLNSDPPTPAEVQAELEYLAGEAGKVVGTFTSAIKGGQTPTEEVEPVTYPDPAVLAAGCGTPCGTGSLPVTDAANGIRLAATAALRAGWNRDDAVTAVAIAGAESGWDRLAVNEQTVNGSNAKGMWQTMMPMHAGLYAGGSWANAYNNADVAHELWESGRWQPWVAYTNGSYAKHLGAATRAVDRVLASQPTETRSVLASAGMGGKGCGSTVPVGDVGDRVWPIPGSTVYRTAYNMGHGAVDINRGAGWDDFRDPVVAAEGGTVECAAGPEQCHGYSGSTVTIDTTSGVRNLYTHLDEWVVTAGDTVVTGQLIGYVGNTGDSSAPHLHFEHDMDDTSFAESLAWLPAPSTYPGTPGTPA